MQPELIGRVAAVTGAQATVELDARANDATVGKFMGLMTPKSVLIGLITEVGEQVRLANDRDQNLIRSAVSDAAANLLAFIPSLGTREVFTFGSGVALPTRMRSQELPAAQRPNSEASGNTRSDGGNSVSHDLLSTVIDRWRSASTRHRMSEDDSAPDCGSPLDTPALAPTSFVPAKAGLSNQRCSRSPKIALPMRTCVAPS